MNDARQLTDTRKAQGFTSQAQLDAFYRAHDHTKSCSICNSVAGAVELHDGLQPFMGRCAIGKQLDAEYFGTF